MHLADLNSYLDADKRLCGLYALSCLTTVLAAISHSLAEAE
jgi:hypothetical protein